MCPWKEVEDQKKKVTVDVKTTQEQGKKTQPSEKHSQVNGEPV